MQQLIESAIKSEIGDIDQLPHSVAARVRDVYGEFIPVYTEMIRIKGKPSTGTGDRRFFRSTPTWWKTCCISSRITSTSPARSRDSIAR